MINILIQAIGKEKSAEMLFLQNEYIKRMQWKVNINEYLPHNSSKDISEIKKAESDLMLKNSTSSGIVIILDESGQMYNSIEFSNLINAHCSDGTKQISFLIGGAYGHSDELKKSKHLKISLSKMTLPHKLVRLILIEQLYRAYTIIQNHPYHKV